MAASDPVTITRNQIQYLAELILDAANQQTEERMVTAVDDTSDDYHIPTALAVNKKVDGIQKFVTLTVASGDPSDVEDLVPDENTLYVVRKAANSDQFIPYIWNETAGFITMPGTDVVESTAPSAITNSEIADAVANAASSVVVIPTPDPEPDPDPDPEPDPGDEPGGNTDEPGSGEEPGGTGGGGDGDDDPTGTDLEPTTGDDPEPGGDPDPNPSTDEPTGDDPDNPSGSGGSEPTTDPDPNTEPDPVSDPTTDEPTEGGDDQTQGDGTDDGNTDPDTGSSGD